MVGWTKDDERGEPYAPMGKDALVADIESCLSCAKNGFSMVFIDVMFPNGFTLKRVVVVANMDDLLCKLMDFSLTCSIADVHTALDDQIMYLILVETYGSTTNIDADVMDAISKLSIKECPTHEIHQPS